MPSSIKPNIIYKSNENSRKKLGTSRTKIITLLLEHTRSYIPLKKNSTKVEVKQIISCNKQYAEVRTRKICW